VIEGMFSGAYQPSLISLFSSTNSDPIALYSTHTDHELPSDSFIHVLNDQSSLPPPEQSRTLISEGQEMLQNLDQNVLHIQSPTLPTTYIRCPPAQWSKSKNTQSSVNRRAGDLGIKHPWMHLQVKNLGRQWSFEVGVVDHAGREGIIRFSTFQVSLKQHRWIYYVVIYIYRRRSRNNRVLRSPDLPSCICHCPSRLLHPVL
jgi:Protein of unknown function (DUF667)